MRCSERLRVFTVAAILACARPVRSYVRGLFLRSTFAANRAAPPRSLSLGSVRSMRRFLSILLALGIGTLVTAVTAALSYLAFQTGAELVSEVLFWPNTLLQSLVPVLYGLPNIGTPDHPLYEGTPVNIAAFFVSFPLGILVYSAVAYVFVCRRQYGLQTTRQT